MDALTESRYFEAALAETRRTDVREETRDLRLTVEQIQDIVFALNLREQDLEKKGLVRLAKEMFDLSASLNNVVCRAYGVEGAPRYKEVEIREVNHE